MPTPLEFMKEYRRLSVVSGVEDEIARVSRLQTHRIQVRKYFMMNWTEGTEQRRDFNTVTRGSRHDVWFNRNKGRILNAAMGKGAPRDYELALEWAVRSGKIPNPTQATIQKYCDDHLGIDCSGFVTNYLIANGKMTYSNRLVRNTNAASYFKPAKAVNDPAHIRRGDLLVWMRGNRAKRRPGHIAVVESFRPQSTAGGNMRVVEATGNRRASPKLLDSLYSVNRIIDKGGRVPVMILIVKRHGKTGSRVAVMRY